MRALGEHHGAPPPGGPPTSSSAVLKFRRLDDLARRGLPVPAGYLCDVTLDLDDPPTLARIEELLARGPVMVRGGLAGEDGERRGGAGLSESVAGCTDLAGVRSAIATVRDAADDPWVRRYHGHRPQTQLLIQREVPRGSLLVAAVRHGAPTMVDVHGADALDALALGSSPDFTGPLARWDHAAAAQAETVARAAAAEVPGPHGCDVELIVDPDGDVWVVQARPLTRDPFPGWTRMRAAIDDDARARGQALDLSGLLRLDAEHNPAPLSPAHAWIIDELRAARPDAGDPVVLAGWLYMRALPREVGARDLTPLSPTEALERLMTREIPAARATLSRLAARASACVEMHPPAADWPALLADALRAFLSMIDVYIGILAPARRGHLRRPDPQAPISLLDRGRFLDVLPATWDIASPSLDELGIHHRPRDQHPGAPPASSSGQLPSLAPEATPRDATHAATMLGELDDHLFALGLAPLRAVWLAAARPLKLSPSEVFLLEGGELLQWLRDATPTDDVRSAWLQARGDRQRARAALDPPLRLLDGAPFFEAQARLRGVPVGPSFEGPHAPREDLADLLRRPPPSDAVVTMGSLTAHAAVALAHLGVRAVCTEHGGALSHGVLMARELGLSALIGCRGCSQLPAGISLRVDTRAGRLRCPPASD